MANDEWWAMRLRPSSDRKDGVGVKGTSLQLPLSNVGPLAMPTAVSSPRNGSVRRKLHTSKGGHHYV